MKNKKIRFVAALLCSFMLMAAPVSAAAADLQDDTYPELLDVREDIKPTGIVLTAPEVSFPAVANVAFDNKADGTLIKWDAVEGAASYQVLLYQEGEWVELASVDKTEYTHQPLENEKTYLYNICAVDAEGKVIAEADQNGIENLFLAPPVISSLTNAENGVSLTWKAFKGAERYRVYRRVSGQSWSRIGETEEPFYTDLTAESGKTYFYTVRCISADGSRFMSFHNGGKSIAYVSAPQITSIENTATGSVIKWNKTRGAQRYRLYIKAGNSWQRIAQTESTSAVHDMLTPGESYVYTVRCVDYKGNFTSNFNRTGWSNTFIEPPVITALDSVDEGVKITWNQPEGAEKYRVYLKNSRGWTRLAETEENTYLDTKAVAGQRYTYTVRCVDPEDSHFTSYYTGGKSVIYVGIPKIKSISNTATGAEITWDKPAFTAKTRVYYKGSNGWVRIGETAGDKFVHAKPVPGETYIYTIRDVDYNGKFLTDYNREGWSNIFIEPPVITSLKGTSEGVQITWDAPNGAEKYRVYLKNSKGWTRVGETAENTYLYTDVKNGQTCTFTVRCISTDGKSYTSYYNSGKSIRFIHPPVITKFENTATGTRVTWEKVEGVEKYRLYVKNGESWERVTETASNSAVHEDLENGATYTYTVRCVDKKGNFTSDYDHDGWNNTFIAPPAISAIAPDEGGVTVSWDAVDGAAGYRLYRKPIAGSWARLFDETTETSYLDASAESGMLYAYTLRCLDENGDVISGYLDTNRFYIDGELAEGSLTVNGTEFFFKDGYLRSGYQTINGKTYYYDGSGNIMKNAIVGSDKEGYCYAGSDGVINYNYCNGVTYKGVDWNVINGKATKATGESGITQFRALKWVAKATNTSMTKEEKLRACFEFLRKSEGITEKNPRIPHYHGEGWVNLYANDMLLNKAGNCFSYASVFAYMAKGIGYTNIYVCNSGGHGWTEINGLIYDPEWSRHNFNYSYFGMSYNGPSDVAYKAAISSGLWWMHVKV